jgi:tRNA pseudouridine55 synthase
MDEFNGIINIIKPLGWTSMDVVRVVKRLTGQKKVGHAGTLDPQASGILPICIGQATRVMEYVVDSPKIYLAKIQLGESTDTYDTQGQVTFRSNPENIGIDDVLNQLNKFRGSILQVPPMYSALKRDGRRLYDLARAGLEIAREPRQVECYSLELKSYQLPEFDIEIECGRGLYVRSLAHDIGEELACGAHLKELDRVSSGPFNYSNAVTMEGLEDVHKQGSWESILFPIDFPLLGLKAGMVQEEKWQAVQRGQGIYMGFPKLDNGQEKKMYRLYSTEGDFVALMRPDTIRGKWRAHKVFKK